MTTKQIEAMFLKAINETAVYNRTQTITENQVYNWRKGRKKPSLGDMLSLLYQLNLIEINEPISQPKQ
jgi:hypothetical protein